MIVPEQRAYGRRPVQVRDDMAPEASPEALRQLELRYRIAGHVVDAYADAGFDVVVQDVILGAHLQHYITLIRSRPLHVVVLLPRPEVVVLRESGRKKSAYGHWSIEELDDVLRSQTSRIGLWLDTSAQTPDETVDEILARRAEALV
jgi:chloramphenicol 3-O-phosphotransferase